MCACSGRAASLLSSGVPAQCLHSLSHSHSHSLAHLLAQSNMQSINQPFSQSMVRPKTHGGLGRRTKRLVPPLERTSSWHSPRKLALQVDPRYAPFPASSSKPNTFHHSLYREKPAARIALRVWTQLHGADWDSACCCVLFFPCFFLGSGVDPDDPRGGGARGVLGLLRPRLSAAHAGVRVWKPRLWRSRSERKRHAWG